MKHAIVALSIILAVLVVIAGILLFGLDGMATEEPPASTIATLLITEEPTAVPTEPTTEAPTEPVLTESVGSYVLDGTTLTAYALDGVDVVAAEDFLTAAGLDESGSAHASDKALVQLTDGAVMLGETTFDTAVDGIVYLPIAAAAEAMGYPTYELDGTTYYTPAARRFTPTPDVNVPVLMYHAVSDDLWGIDELFVSPSSMEEQLKYLTENGYEAIWFEDLAHLEDYEKPVILTFDDGYDDNYTELLPLLQKYQVKATVFVIGNAPGVIPHKMTPKQVREMADSGLVSIQSHSYTHEDMDAMDEATTEYELSESQKAITRLTGRVPYVLCYPTGKYNDWTLKHIGEYYNFGIKMVGGQYNTSDDPFLVNRYYVSRYTDIYGFASYLSNAGK